MARGVAVSVSKEIGLVSGKTNATGRASIDHTTLFKFYNRMETSDTARKLFEELTVEFAEACGTTLKRQRTDSFFIHGWLQILSGYGLCKETLRVFLKDLRKHKPDVYEVISKELSREYLEKEFALTEKYHEAAQRQVRHMAEDMYRVYKAFANQDEVKGYESFKTLVMVFHQQCKVTEGNETSPCEITIREKPEGEEIVSSPHNMDARYVKKGKQKVCGQKGFVSETSDETNKPQFITDSEVTPATRAGCSRASGDSEAFRGVREEAAGAVCRCRVCEWTSDTIFTSRWYKAGMAECRTFAVF
ncbi:MAG TPA: hypothetical protein ACFYD4_05480 [Candidatus Wunengus sp. YC61]|uniref:hypothetical protein n=1 Tax=Candidatus Wunengus sp. YC61 TaxID=3367698 RepID=UPI0040263264